MTQGARIECKKDDIVTLAFDRFYEGGFHATGVDAVMAASGISKRTLYKHFASKEALIEAVLERYAAAFVSELFEPAMAVSDDPLEQIIAFFDVRRALIDESPTRGCLGIKAAQEFTGRHPGIVAKAMEATREVERRFANLCERAGFAHSADLGAQLNVLFQGALILSQVGGDSAPFVSAKVMVSILLDVAVRDPRTAA